MSDADGDHRREEPRARSRSPTYEQREDRADAGVAAATSAERGKVYIGNVPASMTELDVRDLFSPLFKAGATCDSIHFKQGPVGRFGFVHFLHATTGLAELVAKLNGTEWGGQKLRIELSRMNGVKCTHCGRDNHRSSDCRMNKGANHANGGQQGSRYNAPPPAFRPGRGRSRSRSRSPRPSPVEFQRGRDFDRNNGRGPIAPPFDAPRVDDRSRDFEARGTYPPNDRRDRAPLPLDSDRDRSYSVLPVDRYNDRDRYNSVDRAYPVVVPVPPIGYPSRGGRSRSPSPRAPVGRRRSRSRSLSPRSQRRSGAIAAPYPPFVPPMSAYPAVPYPPVAMYADPRDRDRAAPLSPAYGAQRERDPYPPREAAYSSRERDTRDAPRDAPRDVPRDALRDAPRDSLRDVAPRDSLRDAPRDAYYSASALTSPAGARSAGIERGSERDRVDRSDRGDRERRSRDDRRDDRELPDARATSAQAQAYAAWYQSFYASQVHGAMPYAPSSSSSYPSDYAHNSAAPASSSYSGAYPPSSSYSSGYNDAPSSSGRGNYNARY